MNLPFFSSFPTPHAPTALTRPPSADRNLSPAQQGLATPRTPGQLSLAASPAHALAHASNAGAADASPRDADRAALRHSLPPVAARAASSTPTHAVHVDKAHLDKLHADKAQAAAAATAAAVAATGGAATQAAAADGGNSCHQCKNNKPLCEIIFCMNPHTDPRTMRKCRKKFCFACLARGYDIHLPDIPDVDEWVCPACEGLCTCAACKRAGEKAAAAGKAREHDGKLPKCSKSKPKSDLNAHLRAAHANMRAEGSLGDMTLRVPSAGDAATIVVQLGNEEPPKTETRESVPLQDERVEQELTELPGLPLPGLPLPGLPPPADDLPSANDAAASAMGGNEQGDSRDTGSARERERSGHNAAGHNHAHGHGHGHGAHKRRRLGEMELDGADGDCTHPECADAELCQFPMSPPLQPRSQLDQMPERGNAAAAAVFDEASESDSGTPCPDLPPLDRAQGTTLSAQLRSAVAPSSPLALAIAPQAFALTRLPPTVVFGGEDASVVRLAAVDDAGWDLSLLLAAGMGAPSRSEGQMNLDSGQVTPLALRSRPPSRDNYPSII